MTEYTHPHSQPAAGSRITGFLWFAAMLAGWIVFYGLMATSEPTLGELHDRVRELPLLFELLAWLVFFPYVLALTIWESGWAEVTRFALVACCALAWSLAFYPWRRR